VNVAVDRSANPSSPSIGAAIRVLLFTPTLGAGGVDRITLNLVARLDRSRFAPALALLRREGALAAQVAADVPVHVLGSRRLAVSLVAMTRMLHAVSPDVVFCMHTGANVVVAAAHLLARSRARLVLSEASAVLRADRSRARNALELPAKRMLYRRADAIAAVSNGVASSVAAILGQPAAKIAVVYNPVVHDDLARLAAERVDHPWFAPDADVPVIVAVGRLVPIKDYPTLLAAFARVRTRMRARLFVLGDGPLREELAARIAASGLADDVALAGFDPNPYRFMARARLLLHASQSEGLPGAIIEAMACGLPVVSTDCDFGPREVITPGRDGFLAPVGDVAALADRVTELLGDPDRAAAMGAAAARSARRFTTSEVIARYERIITGDA
jgi:glycosyltransferase involved in cell wall biosynthesis